MSRYDGWGADIAQATHTHTYVREALYYYRSLGGQDALRKLKRKCECGAKTFSWSHSRGTVWLTGIGTYEHRPYQVDVAMHEGGTLWVVEGEKDADTLNALGYVATSPPNGTGSWDPEWVKLFSARRVIVVSDKDAPGRQHAAAVAKSFKDNRVNEVRIVEVPDPYKDVSEWMDGKRDNDAPSTLVVEKPASIGDGLVVTYAPTPTPREFESGFVIPTAWTPLAETHAPGLVVPFVNRGEPVDPHQVPLRCSGCTGFLIAAKPNGTQRPCYRCRMWWTANGLTRSMKTV